MSALPFRIEDRGYRTPCWIWRGFKVKGYGRVAVHGRKVVAHRAVYEEVVGPIPDGYVVDHLCEQPACVNPEHLEPVTRLENCRRGRATKLTLDDIRAIRRRCAAGERQVDIAREFGVIASSISNIVARRSWAEV